MYSYQNILVALDIFSDHKNVLERALDIAQNPAHLSFIYVTFPHMYFGSYGFAMDASFVSDNQKSAKATLLELAKEHHIPDTQVYVPIGSPVDEIHMLSVSGNVDLIIIGTHAQSGLKLLLGSTANGVLHGVECDVLAIRI